LFDILRHPVIVLIPILELPYILPLYQNPHLLD
jgi:hypothetical protein